MKSRALLLPFLFSFALAGPAAALTNPVSWHARLEPADIRAGESGQVVLEAKVDAPWHIYSMTPRKGAGPKPGKISLLPNKTLQAEGPAVQPAPKVEFDRGFNTNVEIYETAVAFGLPVKVAPGESGSRSAALKVDFMTCKEGSCLPARVVEVPVSFTVASGPPRSEHTTAVKAVPAQPAGYHGGSGTGTPRAGTSGAGSGGTSPVAAPGAIKTPSGFKGLLPFLLLSIGMGFLSLLTPCVFPMVPITVSFFSKQHQGAPGSGVRAAVAYCLGIIGTYTGLGLLVAVFFTANGLRQFAANPIVNLGLALLFVVLALSLLGAFQLVLPSSLVEKAQAGTARGGLAGPLLMGLTFTLTSFTCTGPFVGGVLGGAALGNVLWPMVGMVAFSTAFASPFFLLALFPQWLARLPRSGSWLVTIKGFMGILELAAALKFLSNADLVWNWTLITRPVFLSVWFALGIIGACYLFGWLRLPHDDSSSVGPVRGLFAAGTLAAAVFCLLALNGRSLGVMDAFLPPPDYGQRGGANVASRPDAIPWLHDYDEGLRTARREGKPVFVNFTGLTCTNCRLMEVNVFPKITDRLREFVPVELYTDREDPESKRNLALQQTKFGDVTLPLYVILTPDGNPVDQTSYFPNYEANPQDFAAFLTRAREKAVRLARGG